MYLPTIPSYVLPPYRLTIRVLNKFGGIGKLIAFPCALILIPLGFMFYVLAIIATPLIFSTFFASAMVRYVLDCWPLTRQRTYLPVGEYYNISIKRVNEIQLAQLAALVCGIGMIVGIIEQTANDIKSDIYIASLKPAHEVAKIMLLIVSILAILGAFLDKDGFSLRQMLANLLNNSAAGGLGAVVGFYIKGLQDRHK